jgi:hypothetical protein
LICGDHVCINKNEAEQFFKKNLSIEVKIIDKKIKQDINLVELNLRENNSGKKEIIMSNKKNIKKKLKILSEDEINKIKKDIKKKERSVKIAKKKSKSNSIKSEIKIKKNKILLDDVNKKKINAVDVCTILEKCNIDEISKYLIKHGKNKGFPDITSKQ